MAEFKNKEEYEKWKAQRGKEAQREKKTEEKAKKENFTKQFICTACGAVGFPKKTVKGSFLVELCLWFLLILPGFLYSLWRVSTKQKSCPKCGNAAMIPLETPRGQQLLREMQPPS